MRLAVVGPAHPIKGGISHYTTLLVRALRKKHEVLYISYEYQYPDWIYPGTGQTSNDESPIHEENDPMWHSLKPWSLNRIAKRMKEFGTEGVILTWVTQFFGWHIQYLSNQIRKQVGAPIVMVCHNVNQHDPLPLEYHLTKMAFKSVDGFIVGAENDLVKLRVIIPDPLYRKHMHPTYDVFATDSEWTRENARAALNLTDEPMLLYFGAVRPYKGLKWLVEAMPDILEKFPRCQAWCVGDYWNGPEEFENQSLELDVLYDPEVPEEGGVRIIAGYIPNEEVGKFFAASDLVVLPYESATQSGIVQIAYGFYKPCLVTDVGGLPEVVLDGKTGYVVPPKNYTAIADKIIEFFTLTDDGRAQMSTKIADWNKEFDWDHMVETVEDILAEVRTGNNGPRP